MKIKAAIFDMDGTLVESLMFWDYVWKEFGKKYLNNSNFRPSDLDDKAVRTMILKDGMALIHKNYGIANSSEELFEEANVICKDFYANKVKVKPGVVEFLDYLNAVIKPLFDSRNINFQMNIKVDDDLIIITDKLRFNQIFFNLLSNASKYTKPDGKASIHINEVNREGDFVHFNISISDNGIGMTKEELDHIEDEYYTTKSYGTGLGIPYIKQIIKLHGGDIKYYSKKDRGTKVLIKLPKEKSPKTF